MFFTKKKQQELPCIELTIDDRLGSEIEVDAVALVSKPAIERNFLAFSNDASAMKFSSINKEKKIVVGPALIPNQLIYRNDPDRGEYNVFFSQETVEQIALKFYQKNFQHNANYQHDPNQKAKGCTFFMSFIRDTEKGMIGLAGKEYPEGTWFLGCKCDDETWAKVQSGELLGFSVEGLFNYSKSDEAFLKHQIKDILKQHEANLLTDEGAFTQIFKLMGHSDQDIKAAIQEANKVPVKAGYVQPKPSWSGENANKSTGAPSDTIKGEISTCSMYIRDGQIKDKVFVIHVDGKDGKNYRCDIEVKPGLKPEDFMPGCIIEIRPTTDGKATYIKTVKTAGPAPKDTPVEGLGRVQMNKHLNELRLNEFAKALSKVEFNKYSHKDLRNESWPKWS